MFIARQDKSETLNETFLKLNNAISTEEMRELNYAVDGDNCSPNEAAGDWLKRKGL